MNEHARSQRGPSAVVDRLVQALNAHDLEAMVACFADDYLNETPVHPQRGFRGNEQVRRNWTQILAGVPDLRALVPRMAVDGDTVWTEWNISGTRRDGAAHGMRGVVIFGVTGAAITSARFYLEPVEETSGDVDASVGRLMRTGTADADQTRVKS
jgi:ketosteroid isomerase-like protein